MYTHPLSPPFLSLPLSPLFLISSPVGVAVCITAFPVLARIISERQLLNTNLGLLILASAACDDGVAWIVLALVIALVRAGSPINALWVLLTTVAFLIVLGTVFRRLIHKVCTLCFVCVCVFVLCVCVCHVFSNF